MDDALLGEELGEEQPVSKKGGARSYFLATVRPDNFQLLKDDGLGYFAVSSLNHKVQAEDRIALYRSAGGHGALAPAGIVGTFAVTAAPRRDGSGPLGGRFGIRIPWRVVLLAIDDPLPLGPLIQKLVSFKNKEHYGPALGRGIKRIWPGDYRLLETALRAAGSA